MKECLFFCQKSHCVWQSMIFKPTLPAAMIEQKYTKNSITGVSKIEKCRFANLALLKVNKSETMYRRIFKPTLPAAMIEQKSTKKTCLGNVVMATNFANMALQNLIKSESDNTLFRDLQVKTLKEVRILGSRRI